MKKVFLLSVILLSVSAVSGFSFTSNDGKVALIEISGSIGTSGGVLSAKTVTPEQVRNLNKQAMKRNADAVIYEINSGGGAVVASKEILREIESVEVPTVCRMRDIAASGGYLVSAGCDHVVADRSSLTGSIGVKASFNEYTELMDRLGIDHVNITAGKRKDVGSPFRNVTDKDREILAEKTEKVHEDFISLVKERRNLSDQETANISTGEVFLGDEAEELGLVDSLGGREKAVSEAENLTDRNLDTFKVESQADFQLLDIFLGSTDFGLGQGLSPIRAVY